MRPFLVKLKVSTSMLMCSIKSSVKLSSSWCIMNTTLPVVWSLHHRQATCMPMHAPISWKPQLQLHQLQLQLHQLHLHLHQHLHHHCLHNSSTSSWQITHCTMIIQLVQPSLQPSLQPHLQPSLQPSLQPRLQPSLQPSLQPRLQPSLQPCLQSNQHCAAASAHVKPPSICTPNTCMGYQRPHR